MHDRAVEPTGAATIATASAIEIMTLLNIKIAYSTSYTAGREKRSAFLLVLLVCWLLLFFAEMTVVRPCLMCVFSFDFLEAFCEEEGSDLLLGDYYEN